MSTSTTRKSFSFNEKIEIIDLIENKKCSVRDIQKKYQCGKSQIYRMLKQKELVTESSQGTRGKLKRKVPKTGNEEINTLTWEWFVASRAKNIPLSGPMVQEQAKRIAETLGKTAFKASNGWLESFKARHNIIWTSVCVESSDVDVNIVNNSDQEIVESDVATYNDALKYLKVLESFCLNKGDSTLLTIINAGKNHVEAKILKKKLEQISMHFLCH